MHPIVEDILERPVTHRIGILVVTLLLIGGGFWMYVYSPKFEEVQALRDKKEDLQTKITNERRLAMNLGRFREEVKALDLKLKIALQELPDAREIPDLLSSISNLARDSGLEVNLFKPKSENFKDFYAEVPVEIAVAGTFHQVATFFDEVGQLSRIVNINQIMMQNPKVEDNLVRVSSGCTATTFRYLDESERVAQDKGKKKRRRR